MAVMRSGGQIIRPSRRLRALCWQSAATRYRRSALLIWSPRGILFARPDFVVQEIGPWSENGQVWRRLFVTYPDNVAFHSRQQTYYFDGEGSLRRLDYVVDILGSAPVVDLPTWYRLFDGIRVPTRRRVYVRKPDGSPDLESISVAVDIRRVTFD
jgi:hypothetical protein